MTCVVGIQLKQGTLLAADSQWSGDNLRGLDTESKVFALSDIMAMGCCGSGRTMQILKNCVTDGLDDPPLNQDVRRWYVRDFQPIIRGVLEDNGKLHKYEEDSIEEMGDSAFLLVIRDRLFTVESDFSTCESLRPFVALASGGEAAQGAMHSEFEKLKLPDKPVAKSWAWAEDVAARAIRAASEDTLYVGGPITFVRVSAYTAEEKASARRVVKGGPTYREDDSSYKTAATRRYYSRR